MIDDAALGARLREAAEHLDVPDADLRSAVVAQLAEGDVPGRGTANRWLLVAAVVLVVLVVGTLAIAPARDAVADWLGIGSTSVQHVPESELPDGLPPEFGDEVPVDGPSPMPALGEPNAAFRDDRGVISYAWDATDDVPELGDTGWGAVLSVRPVAFGPADLKLLAQDDEVVAVTIGGATGLWIPGDHIRAVPGQPPAIARRVLLWIAGQEQYRLETELPLDDAVALAEGVEGTDGG